MRSIIRFMGIKLRLVKAALLSFFRSQTAFAEKLGCPLPISSQTKKPLKLNAVFLMIDKITEIYF